MTDQPEHLIASLRAGLCVEGNRCRSLTAKAGCDCAKIADCIELLHSFHEAWVEAEVSMATGDPDLAKQKRKALIDAHHAVRALTSALTPDTANSKAP